MMSIALPTEASKPVTELGKQTILLYGSPKLGKSSFASKAPGSLFFECEPGSITWRFSKCRPIRGKHSSKLASLWQGRSQLQNDCDRHRRQRFQDVLGLCLCQAWYRVRGGHGPRQRLGSGQERMASRADSLASLPYGLILISHAVDKTIETRTASTPRRSQAFPIALATWS